jgi:calcineurin-like phosphoesterase family protein
VFADIDHHDAEIVKRHNAIVKDEDRAYLLGDVCINRNGLGRLHALKGRKVLVKGNHDIFKLQDYLPIFDDIMAYVVKKTGDGYKVVLSHIPIHPDPVGRFGINVHGHFHSNKTPDPRYKCVSLEHINYTPIELHKACEL